MEVSSETSHANEWQTLENGGTQFPRKKVGEEKIVIFSARKVCWHLAGALCVSWLTLVIEDKTTHANCRVVIFFPYRIHKEALWIQGEAELKAPWGSSNTSMGLHMSVLSKITWQGVISNSRWGGWYVLT